MFSGMSFHSLGTEAEKARKPSVTYKFLLDDRKHLLGLKVSNKSLI